MVRSSQNPQYLTDPHTLLKALKPHLVSQMMFCCINVQRVIKVQKVLEQRQRKRYEGKNKQKEEAETVRLCCSETSNRSLPIKISAARFSNLRTFQSSTLSTQFCVPAGRDVAQFSTICCLQCHPGFCNCNKQAA